MSNESFQRECTNYSQNTVLSYNRRGFSGDPLTSIDDLATRLADDTFRAEFLGEYGLITPESRTKYSLPATAANRQKGFGERLAEAAKRHFNPLYNYNVNGVTREIQADLARSVADIHAGDDVEEVISNAKYRETKSILINYALMNSMAGVSGGVSGGVSAGGAFATAQDYADLRDTTFESYDHVFTQRRQAFAQDLAIYGKAAVLGGLLATGAGALVVGGVLGAYASRAVAGTAIASLSGDGAGGKIASAVALLGISGLAYVTAAYAAKGGLEYAANYAKKQERQLDDVVNHTAGGATIANEERQARWHSAHNAARWGSGIISYLMPLIAFADAPDIEFSKLGKKEDGSGDDELGECLPDARPSALEDCVKERFTYGKDIHKGVELREVYDYHTTPLTPEAGHEQGLTIDMKTWKDGSVSLNGVYDEHTPCDFNVDSTVVMLEHYTDVKALDYRVLVDVDASGHFEIPKEFATYKGDDIQVTWASITHCENGKLGLEDLASYTHGKHVVIPNEAVFSGSVPAHVAPHYIDCDGTADAVTPAPTHTDAPKDDCGPCKTACDQEYYVPVGVIDSKAGPCPEGAPVMSSSAFVPAGTLDNVVNTFGYVPSDAPAVDTPALPGTLDAPLDPFGYGPDAAAPLDAPAGTLDQNVNSFEDVAPGIQDSTLVPDGTLDTPANPFGTDAMTYNLGQYYEETYYIDDEVLRAFERQQQAALELRLV